MPDGQEKITISPVNNSIYDNYGNIASGTQAGNVLPLSQSKILSKGELEFDNVFGSSPTFAQVSGNIYAVA